MAVLFSSLPLGFRFRPTDEELVDYYLRLKINGNDNDVRVIREIDVCKREPWDLPDLSVIPTRDLEWFFFCPLDRKYPNGHRSNRATIAGYWKATGKDRKIKSGVSLIGMKKTLVFHTGRAPNGKRTNWVMHEYRATQKELDGTNPGQSAFVLCRLFKKQDESIEDSNCDGVEPTISSPTASNLSPEEMQSEGALVQESPVLNEKRPTKEECCLAENFNGTDSDCLALVECHKNGYDAEDKVADVAANEVDLQLEGLDLFYDPILEPLDCKIFSPLHSQMQMELGSSSMFSVTNGLRSVYSEVQFQYGTNEPDTSTSDFLNSVLKNTDEYFCETIKNSAIEGETPKNTVFLKEGESHGGSYAKEAKALVETNPGDYQTLTPEYDVDEGTKNLVLLQNNPYKWEWDAISTGSGVEPFCNMIDNLEGLTSDTNDTGRGDTGTGIRTRPRQPQNDPCIENSVSQGTAPRRLHLQLNLAKPDHSVKKPRDWSGPDYHEPRFVLQMGNITEEHSSAGDSNAATSTMDDHQKPYPFGSREDSKFTQEPRAGMRPKFRAQSKKSTSEKVTPVLSKTLTHHSNWSFAYISMVIVLVVVVFITSVGIWRWLEF